MGRSGTRRGRGGLPRTRAASRPGCAPGIGTGGAGETTRRRTPASRALRTSGSGARPRAGVAGHDAGAKSPGTRRPAEWRAGPAPSLGTAALPAVKPSRHLLTHDRPVTQKPRSEWIDPPADLAPGPVDIDTTAPTGQADSDRHRLADHFVVRAHKSGARVRFVENGDLLADVGGVGALLRFKI